MTTIAELAVKLIGDIAQYKKSMSEAEGTAKKTAAEISKSMQEIGGKLAGVGKSMTAFVTLPLAGASVAAVNMASDLEETKNKVSVVFGSMGKDVLTWSKNSATAFGQSQNQALEAAATYGNLFVTMGLGQKPAADMSMSLVQLAADLASFNNADPSEVLAAMQSGLIGEAEPMRRFGVLLSEAAVQAKAMEMGLAGADGELSEAAKLQARYALILEQSKTAQGDFARTADGLANMQRILKSQFQDTAAALGQQLLPYALQFVQWASGMVAKLQALTPEQQKFVLIIVGLVAAIGPAITILGTLISSIGAIIPVVTAVAGALTFPLILVIGLVVAAIAVLAAAWKNDWGGIRETVWVVVQNIKMVIGVFLTAIRNWWDEHGAQVIATVKAMWAFVANIFKVTFEFLFGLVKLGLDNFRKFWMAHGAQIIQFTKNLWDGIVTIFKTFWSIVKPLFEAFQAAFRGDWYTFGQKLREAWDALWTAIKTLVSKAWDNLKEGFKNLVENVIKFFKETDWKQVGIDILKGIGEGIKSAFNWVLDQMQNLAKAIYDMLRGFFDIASPSGLMKRMIGEPLALGVVAGWEGVLKVKPLMPALAQATNVNQLTPNVPMPVVRPATVPQTQATGGLDAGMRYVMDELVMRMRSLPDDLARANASAFEKVAVRR